MRRKKSALKFVFPLVCLVIIFFGGIFIFRSLMGKFLSSAFPISVPETPAAPRLSASTSTASTTEVLRPSASTTSTANGSFTELFSGTGWLNQEKSNVYQDQKLSSISFPPDYEWQEIPALSESIKDETIYGEPFNFVQDRQSRTIIAADGNGKEIVLVAKSGKIFEFKNDTEQISEIRVNPLLNGSVPRESAYNLKNAALDYDDSAGVWIVAAETDDGFVAGPIYGEQSRTIGQISPINYGSSTPIVDGGLAGLACANGECLVLLGPKIYRFAESAEVELPKEVQLPNIDSSSPKISSVSIGKAKNTLLVGVVEKKGGTYNGSIFKYNSPFPKGSTPQGGGISSSPFLPVAEKLFSSPYPGTIRFGYDSENDEILALYAAYIGQAYKFSVNPLLVPEAPRQSASILSASTTDDFSRFFPQRVMDGDGVPKIFKYGNAWWLSSEVNQTSAKFIRIEGGAGIDFADTLLRGQQTFELLPGFNPNELYGITGGQEPKIYKFTDKGYKKDKKIVWESLRLNRFDNEITGGKFYKINGSMESPPVIASEAQQSQGNIRYYLSNDGGKTWKETKLNEMVNFATKGNDFRFKVELNSAQRSAPFSGIFRADSLLDSTTPWLNLISVEYYSKP